MVCYLDLITRYHFRRNVLTSAIDTYEPRKPRVFGKSLITPARMPIQKAQLINTLYLSSIYLSSDDLKARQLIF